MQYVMGDFVDFDRAALRAVFNAYVNGAVKVAEHRGVTTFAICVGAAELRQSTDHQHNGWRYKLLTDGVLYLHASAIYDVAIGQGMAKSVPWLQNKLNPRLSVSFVKNGKRDRIMAEFDARSLLLRSGDVETNPGPIVSIMVQLFVLISAGIFIRNVCYYDLGFSAMSVAHGWTFIMSYLALPFQAGFDFFYDKCVADHLYREWWANCYNSYALFIYARFMHLLGFAPSESEVQQRSFVCSVVERIRPMPVLDTMYVGVWFSLCCMFVTWSCALLIVCYCITRRPRYIKVINKQRPFDVTQLRMNFQKFKDEYQPPQHIDGAHHILAHQRRECEKFAFNTLYTQFSRVRDIGGSRKRFASLGVAKHICSPCLSNSDILRDDTNNFQFDNCTRRGEECPHRFTICAAILSHVDYHCSKEQLTAMITGPTFIINHDFNRFNAVGEYSDGEVVKFEAYIKNVGGLVTMTPDGGTSYTDHSYHHWQNEGTVVSAGGAFTYTRLGDYGETSVYYCHPSNGVYNVDDDSALATSVPSKLPYVCGYQVTLDHATNNYLARNVGISREISLDGAVVTECAMTMASSNRNSKYYDTLRSFVTGKLKAKEIDLKDMELYVGLIAYLSDLNACDKVFMASVVVGNPSEFTFRHVLINKFIVTLTYFSRPILRNLLTWYCSRSYARYYAPWLFRTVRVPSYEVYTKNNRSTLGSGLYLRYGNFRDDTATSDTSNNQQFKSGACSNASKHDNITRVKSPKPSAFTDALLDSLFPSANSSNNNAITPILPTPLGSEQLPRVKVRNVCTQRPKTPEIWDESDESVNDGPERNDDGVNRGASAGLQAKIHSFSTLSGKPPCAIIRPSFATHNGRQTTVWKVLNYGGPELSIPIPGNVEHEYAKYGISEADFIGFIEDMLRESEIRNSHDVRSAVLWIAHAALFHSKAKPYVSQSFKPERYGILCNMAGSVVPNTHKTCAIRDVEFAVPCVPKEPVSTGSAKSTAE